MINKWMNLLHEDLENDPWRNEETAYNDTGIADSTFDTSNLSGEDTADLCTEQTAQDDPWLKEEKDAAARKRTTRRPAYSLALRAVAFATFFIFAMNALPTRMIAHAGPNDKILNGPHTASELIGLGMTAADSLSLNGNMTLDMDTDLNIQDINLGNFRLELTGNKKLTLSTQWGTPAINCPNGTLVVNGAQMDASIGNTQTMLILNELQVQNGGQVYAAQNSGNDGNTLDDLVTLRTPLQTDNLSITTNPAGNFEAVLVGGVYYLQANNNKLASITIRHIPPTAKKESDGSGGSHTHNYVWKVVKEATEDESGEEDYICEGCGSVLYRIPLTAAAVFCKNTVEKIKKAPANGTVEISTKRWNSFHYMVRDALLARPDVTLRINFLSEGYKGTPLTITIPAGYDVSSLFDSNGYMGFLFAGSKLGYN